MTELRDEFLSEEDLDLRNMSRAEVYAYCDQWLLQAQSTNEKDRRRYTHGVFTMIEAPEADERPRRVAEEAEGYGRSQLSR